MDNNKNKATNQEITSALELMNSGANSASNQLVFDPSTGQFVVAKPGQKVGPDATTINSIARDGFAN